MFLGAIHVGVGHTHSDNMFKIMDLPGLTSKTFKVHENLAGLAVEDVAEEGCNEFSLKERDRTLENLEAIREIL